MMAERLSKMMTVFDSRQRAQNKTTKKKNCTLYCRSFENYDVFDIVLDCHIVRPHTTWQFTQVISFWKVCAKACWLRTKKMFLNAAGAQIAKKIWPKSLCSFNDDITSNILTFLSFRICNDVWNKIQNVILKTHFTKEYSVLFLSILKEIQKIVLSWNLI